MINLEKDDTISRTHSHRENSLRSIAIRLKRIADVMCNPPMVCPPDLSENDIMQAMSGDITAAMKGVK